MRIRSIKPEFWESTSISRLAIEDRLLFIGLWSYVDDNGVGIDKLARITADLFADDLEAEPRETYARVSRGLASLFAAGRITRYEVDGTPYLSITNWTEHQRVDRPGKSRYPLPTREDAKIRETVATPSRDIRETLALGAVEQGSRGAEEQELPCSTASAVERVADNIEAEFAMFWQWYPRKVGRATALKAYRAARRKVDERTIAAAFGPFVEAMRTREPDKIPHAATWLNREPWHDDPEAIAPTPIRRDANGIDWNEQLARAAEIDRMRGLA